jgi:hypothetical protein
MQVASWPTEIQASCTWLLQPEGERRWRCSRRNPNSHVHEAWISVGQLATCICVFGPGGNSFCSPPMAHSILTVRVDEIVSIASDHRCRPEPNHRQAHGGCPSGCNSHVHEAWISVGQLATCICVFGPGGNSFCSPPTSWPTEIQASCTWLLQPEGERRWRCSRRNPLPPGCICVFGPGGNSFCSPPMG